MIEAEEIIFEYYRPGSRLAEVLLDHSRRVRDKALSLAEGLGQEQIDTTLVAQGAMLHDIGIFQTDAPSIHCHGDQPYLRHGIIGRKLLEAHGLDRLALVCERHVGVGITMADIDTYQLPLPRRDMTPQTLEEILICYADKFFSKANGGQARSLAQVLSELARYGENKVAIFQQWHARLGA